MDHLYILIEVNMMAKIKSEAAECLTDIVKNLEIGKRSDLNEEIRSRQRRMVREKPVKTSKWSRSVRIRVGIETVNPYAELVQQRRTEGVSLIDLGVLRSQLLRRYLSLIKAEGIVGQRIVDVVADENSILFRDVVIDPDRSGIFANNIRKNLGILDLIESYLRISLRKSRI